MISKSCNFNEFLDKITDCDYADIILITNEEATAAERTFYKKKAKQDHETKVYEEYAVVLKDFIGFLRNGIKPSSIREFDFQYFDTVRDNWKNPRHEC